MPDTDSLAKILFNESGQKKYFLHMKGLYTQLEQIFKCSVSSTNWISRSIKLEEDGECQKLVSSESYSMKHCIHQWRKLIGLKFIIYS